MHVEGLVVNPPVWDRLKRPNLIRPFRWPLPRTPNPIPWRRSSQGDNRPGAFRPFHQTGSGQAPEQLQSSLGVLLGFRVHSVVDNSVPTDQWLVILKCFVVPIGPYISSSFLGLPYGLLNMNHKEELLWGLWVLLC